MFHVVGHQVCKHLRRDFDPLLFTEALSVVFIGCYLTTLLLPCSYVLGHCHDGKPIHDSSSVLWLREGGSRSCTWPLNASSLSYNHIISSIVDAREPDFGLIWLQHFLRRF